MEASGSSSPEARPLSGDAAAGGLAGALRRRLADRSFIGLTGAAALLSSVVVVLIAATVVWDGWPAFSHFGLAFVYRGVWNPVTGVFGARNLLLGTLISSFFAILIATPIAVAIALFLTEIAPRFVAAPVALLVELLAAIPSVVLGLWGIDELGPRLDSSIEPWLHHYLGFIPLFGGRPAQVGMLNAILILTIMIVPIVTAISREVFLRAPKEYKEGALALGLTQFEAIRGVMLPYAAPGIAAAAILGLGRALGEAIAVAQVIGATNAVHASLFAPSDTMAGRIANEYFGAATRLQLDSLVALGTILLAITLAANLVAQWIAVSAERRGMA